MKKKLDGFEKREQNPNYWDDKRWKKVDKLRKQGKDVEANGLVSNIRYDWGM